MNKINIGSGKDKKEGYVNLDWDEASEPDIRHDLNKYPYPFPDSSFDLAEAYHVLEHLDRPFDAMREFHRILRPGGRLLVRVPHFSRGFTHAEHAHGFDLTFPHYFNPAFSGSGYTGVHFRLLEMKLTWSAHPHVLVFMGYGKFLRTVLSILNFIISGLANLWPAFASRIWCYWVGGFEEIRFEFVCEK